MSTSSRWSLGPRAQQTSVGARAPLQPAQVPVPRRSAAPCSTSSVECSPLPPPPVRPRLPVCPASGDLRPPLDAMGRYKRRISVDVAGVPFALEIIPAEECLRAALTDTPRNVVIGAMIFAAFVIATGVCYEVLSRRFLLSVLRDALKSHEARFKAEKASAEAKERFVTTGAPDTPSRHPLALLQPVQKGHDEQVARIMFLPLWKCGCSLPLSACHHH